MSFNTYTTNKFLSNAGKIVSISLASAAGAKAEASLGSVGHKRVWVKAANEPHQRTQGFSRAVDDMRVRTVWG